jgi:hypothetical protein
MTDNTKKNVFDTKQNDFEAKQSDYRTKLYSQKQKSTFYTSETGFSIAEKNVGEAPNTAFFFTLKAPQEQ